MPGLIESLSRWPVGSGEDSRRGHFVQASYGHAPFSTYGHAILTPASRVGNSPAYAAALQRATLAICQVMRPAHAVRPWFPEPLSLCSLLPPPWPTARSVCSRGVCKLLDHALRQRTAHMAAAAAGERGHVYLLCQACRRGTTVPPSSTNAHINRNGVQSELR